MVSAKEMVLEAGAGESASGAWVGRCVLPQLEMEMAFHR